MEIEIKTLDEARDGRVQVVITVDGATSTDPARRLYTAQEVGELQASEAELVATPLRGQIAMLKLDVDSLQRQLAEANDRCEKNAHVALEGRQLVVELERQRAELTSAMDAQEINHLRETDELRSILRQVNHEKRNLEDALVKSQEATALALNQRNEYDRDRKTERDRADQNKAWAERAEAELARRSTEGKAQVDRLVETGRELRDKVRELTQDLRDRDQMIKRVRETVWARNLDRPVENRADMEVISAYGSDLVDAVAHVRSRVGQPTTSQA